MVLLVCRSSVAVSYINNARRTDAWGLPPMVKVLEDLGIVVEMTVQKKNRSYSYQAYVERRWLEVLFYCGSRFFPMPRVR